MLQLNFTRVSLVFFFLVFSSALMAQQNGTRQAGQGKPGGQGFGVISGTLRDETTKDQIQFGSTALYKTKDSTLLTGAITDEKGKFIFNNIAAGNYYLKASFIGYEVKYVPGIVISAQSADVKLGDISIKQQQATLSGVEVVAKKALISNNLDKKVVTVDKSMALGGGTATDVMQNVPSVAVDAEGNVSLRGNSNITLLIDGKPASQAGISSSDILNQLPASAIESVEVITNPSVKYDPDGTSGIINIVLKKKALQGFNGLVSVTAGTGDKYNGSFNLNYRTSKLNMFVGIDARSSINTSSSESERTSTFGDVVNILRQTQSGSFKRNSMNFSGGVDYTIDTRNNLTLSVQKRKMTFSQEGTMIYKNYYGEDSLQRYFDRFTNSSRSISSTNYTLSYKHTFPQKGREFTQDIVFNNNKMDNDQQIDQQEYDIVTFEKTGLPQLQQNFALNKNYFLTVQGNYIQPFEKGGRLEAGYKYSLRDLVMDYDYTNFNYDTIGWENQENLKNHYDFNEQLIALYSIYSNSWKKFKYQAGLRYEQVYTTSKVEQTDSTYNKNYFSLYPSLHTQYDLGKGRELQFSYSRRVDRPSPREMNPYIDYSDSLNISQGNPDLNPEYSNSLEMGVMKYWDKYSLTSTAFFRNTAGLIEDITRIDSTGITYTMPQNVNKSESYGLEFVLAANPYKWLRVNGNLSLYQYWVSDIPELNIPETKQFTWSGRVNATFTYSKNGSFQLIGNYASPSSSPQSTRTANYTIDASVRQDFFKNKLTVSLRATDIFNTRNFNSTTTGDNFVSVNKRYMESRVFYAGVQFRINNYSKKVGRDVNAGDNQDQEGFQ